MPSLSSLLKEKLHLPPSSSPTKTYYLASPSSTAPPLHPIPNPRTPRAIPDSCLLFCLTHPPPATSEGTLFFIDCLPDPIGFLYHCAIYIHRTLALDPNSKGQRVGGAGSTGGSEDGRGFGDIAGGWRHQLIELELENKPGLAATSGGVIHVSLQWVEDVLKEVKEGRKEREEATKEFKGVLLHELTHTLQHDASSTCPGWLIESIADYIRLTAHLDPPHWRKPGQGRAERGWEDSYDSGARFLAWITGFDEGVTTEGGSRSASGNEADETLPELENQMVIPTPLQGSRTTGTSTSSGQPAQATQYPSGPAPPVPTGRPHRTKKRREPFPDFVKELDARMLSGRWNDEWWEDMCGAGLEVLWEEYLGYHA